MDVKMGTSYQPVHKSAVHGGLPLLISNISSHLRHLIAGAKHLIPPLHEGLIDLPPLKG